MLYYVAAVISRTTHTSCTMAISYKVERARFVIEILIRRPVILTSLLTPFYGVVSI